MKVIKGDDQYALIVSPQELLHITSAFGDSTHSKRLSNAKEQYPNMSKKVDIDSVSGNRIHAEVFLPMYKACHEPDQN